MQLLFINGWMNEGLARSIGWTLIHSLWQGLIAAALAGIIILSTRHGAARFRYNLLALVMIEFFIGTMITFILQLDSNNIQPNNSTNAVYQVNDIRNGAISLTDHSSEIGIIDSSIAFFNANANLLVTCWAILFLFHCFRLMTGLAGVNRLRHANSTPVSIEWKERMNSLAKELGIMRPIALMQSASVKIPVAIGVLRPMILVPAGLFIQLPAEQVETILIHELAHIRRNDYLVNIMQRMVEAVFFFNPAVRWISSLLRQEREACCDDIVVANTSHKGIYLEALVSFQESNLSSGSYAMAIGSNKHYLLNRVRRMLTRENKKLNRMEKSILICCLLAVTALSFINKQDVPVVQASLINEPLKPAIVTSRTEAIELPKPTPRKSKAVVRQSKSATTSAVQLSTVKPIVKDTVPVEVSREPKESRFEGISRQVNDDGKTRKESVIATGKDGKKYTFNRNNGKVSDLTVDGKPIPENEIKNYSEVLDLIDTEIEQRREIRERKSVERTANLRKQQELMGRKREEVRERIQEEKARKMEEQSVKNRERVSRIAADRETDRETREVKIKDVERKNIELQKKITELKEEQQKIERKIEKETRKKIEIERKIENQKKVTEKLKVSDKTTSILQEYKINLVKNFDMQPKFELKQNFKVEELKFKLKTDAWGPNEKIKSPTVPPTTPKPPTPPSMKKEQPKTDNTKPGAEVKEPVKNIS